MYKLILILITGAAIAAIALWLSARSKKKLQQRVNEKLPDQWRQTLLKDVAFYAQLNEADKSLFEKRVHRFLLTKDIEPVDTEIDDTIRLLVASSAVIPTFAFPDYNYPKIRTVLIYPGHFNEKYQISNPNIAQSPIIGMVDSRFQNGTTVILSKPDLVAAFDGSSHKGNVGIHEFVHLLDKEDGEVDGIPEALLKHQYVGPWLQEIKNEMRRIEHGKSDISLYALTNNAEFLAVVSEYFFDNPEKFRRRHPELYQRLCMIFNQDTSAPRSSGIGTNI